MDDRLGWCIGCKRTRAEIKAWSTASEGEKRKILENLAGRAESEPSILDRHYASLSQNCNNKT
jgi:predicted Fe-S protein YdhL (DUF1289 family)